MAVRPVALGLAGALLALAALVGCQGPEQYPGGLPADTPGAGPTASCETAPEQPHDPLRLFFPTQRLRVDVTRVGLTDTQDFNMVPLDAAPLVAGWYCEGVRPGEPGPAVMIGHVDWGGSRAAFGRIAALKTGEPIQVTRRDGTQVDYRVSGRQQVKKASFPFDRVFGDLPVSRLTLITCGGTFDHRARSYVDSDIIYANTDPAGSG